jgi:hypothetical protein
MTEKSPTFLENTNFNRKVIYLVSLTVLILLSSASSSSSSSYFRYNPLWVCILQPGSGL